jgi:hypothetical protein
VTVGDVEYTVTGKAPEVVVNNETDADGNVTQVAYNKQTGQTTMTPLGNIGTAKEGWQTQVLGDGSVWRVNPKTGQSMPFYASQAQETWNALYPEGSVGPVLPGNPAARGQCGAALNLFYGQRILGNSYPEKLAAMKNYGIKTADEAEVGDTFLMSAGDTGHVGIINAIDIGPDGKKVFKFTESNMVPPNGGLMSHSRTMAADDPRLKAFASIPTPNLPLAGPDSFASTVAAGGGGILGAGTKTKVEADKWSSERLSYDEAQKAGVPYGTTRGQLAEQGKVPGQKGPPKAAQTFEQFLAAQEEKAGMAFSPAKRESLKAEFQQGQDAVKLYGQAIRTLARNGQNADQRRMIEDDLNQYIADEDWDGLERAITTTARNSMPAARQAEFDQYANGADTWDEALQFAEDAGRQLSAGPYKYVIEEKKPFVGASRDPAYATLLQTIELGQAQIRRGYYGTAVTDTEAATAKKFLVDPETDDLATIKLKLKNGSNYMRWVNDANVASIVGLPKPKLGEYVDMNAAAGLKAPRKEVLETK